MRTDKDESNRKLQKSQSWRASPVNPVPHKSDIPANAPCGVSSLFRVCPRSQYESRIAAVVQK